MCEFIHQLFRIFTCGLLDFFIYTRCTHTHIYVYWCIFVAIYILAKWWRVKSVMNWHSVQPVTCTVDALHCWISIYCMQHPAGLCAYAVTKWRSRLTVWLQDWWLVGLCMTLHDLILSYFIIWCAIDYTIICPSEKRYGDQSIWFSILDVQWGCDIDPEDIFPEAQSQRCRSWLSDGETGIEHQSCIDWHRIVPLEF